MTKNSTMTRPKELCPKVIIIVRMKIYPEKGNYHEDDSTLILQCITMHPNGLIVNEQ